MAKDRRVRISEQVSVAFIEILRVIVVSLIIICSVVRRVATLGASVPSTASLFAQ
nr:MAG TPA: hypothetical protein [Caudoviricetes sp.]